LDRKSRKPGEGSGETRRIGIGIYVYADDDMKASPYFSTSIDEDEEQKLANE
jgi:hypothetical protein